MIYNSERPYRFDDMVGQTCVVENIREQAKKNKFFHAYLFVGQWGGGKTTMARILAAAVNCEHKDENGNPCGECQSCKAVFEGGHTDVIELDAASNNGVESIRALKDSVAFLPQMGNRKVYIVDEVHMLSNNAWNALLKVLEEPPVHVLFVLCTTELKKVPNTVRSRCATYQFRQVTEEEMYPAVERVCKKHDFSYTPDGLNLLIKNSHGSMRDVLSLLEQVAEKEITEQSVADMLGISNQEHLLKILDSLLSKRTPDAIRMVSELENMGKDLFLAVNELLEMAADGVMCSMAGRDSVKGTAYYREVIAQFTISYPAYLWSELITSLLAIREEIVRMPGRTSFICGIIRMNDENSMSSLLERIERLEKGTLVVSVTEEPEEEEEIPAEDLHGMPSQAEEEMESPSEMTVLTEAKPDVPEPEEAKEEKKVPDSDANEVSMEVQQKKGKESVKEASPQFAIPSAFSFLSSINMQSSFETVEPLKEERVPESDAVSEYISSHPEEKVFAACINASRPVAKDTGEVVYEAPFPPIETILETYKANSIPELKISLQEG